MAYLDAFDSRQLRNVLGTFATGVTIVTTLDSKGQAHGVTANSFSSVSLDPPLVLWSQALTSKSLEAFRESEYFAINVLADDQIAMSNHFARTQEDKFANMTYSAGLGGAPVLPGTSAHFECRKVATHPGGDHVVYFGQVERIGHSGRRPLAFAHGRYMIPYAHALGPLALEMRTVPTASVETIRYATSRMESISVAVGGHTLSLAVWGNHGPTVIAWQPGKTAAETLATGQVLSTTRTAAGRAFAAFLPGETTRTFIEEDLRLYRVADEDDQVQKALFEQELSETKQRGFARVLNTKPGSVAGGDEVEFSAPIFNANGDMILAFTMKAGMETPGSDGQHEAITLTHAAASVSAYLGYKLS